MPEYLFKEGKCFWGGAFILEYQMLYNIIRSFPVDRRGKWREICFLCKGEDK